MEFEVGIPPREIGSHGLSLETMKWAEKHWIFTGRDPLFSSAFQKGMQHGFLSVDLLQESLPVWVFEEESVPGL